LILQARRQPDSLLAALSRAFSVAASSPDDRERNAQITRARHLADAFAIAWNDSFHVRDVSRFAAWSQSQRTTRVLADSLKRAGTAALGSEGVPRAMQLFRESLRRAAALHDPSSLAPTLVAIGVGFYRDGQLDSAATYLESGKRIAVESGDRRTVGNAIGMIASISKDRGSFDRAVALYMRASAIRSRIGDTRGVAADYNNLGLIAQERGDLRGATRAFERALTMNQRDGRLSLVALNLSNLAGVASANAEYRRADSLYTQALSQYKATRDNAEMAFTLHELGRLQMRRGDYGKAEATLTAALRAHVSTGATADAIEVRNDLAAVKNAAGDPEGALTVLRQAERDAVATNALPGLRGRLAMTRADLLMQFGTFDDANESYARAAKLYREATDDAGLAQARHGEALLLHLRGDENRSLALLTQVAKTQLASRDRRGHAITLLLMSEVEAARRDTLTARATLNSARATFREIGDVVGEAAALNTMGDLSAAGGLSHEAERLYRSGITRLGNRSSTDVAWRLHAGLAEALRRQGKLDGAAAELRSAIDIFEREAAGFRLEERKSRFLADKWSVYSQLAFLEQHRNNAGGAFAVSERLRARQMVDLLARGSVATRFPASQKEQDLRRRIAEFSRELEVRGLNQTGTREPALASRSGDAIRVELNAAQRAYSNLIMEMRETAPEYARLVSGKTVSWRTVASRLEADEVFLEYLLGDSTSTVFVVTPDTVAAIDLRVGREELINLIEFSRRTIERGGNSATSAKWRIPLRRLYMLLVQPVEKRGYLKGRLKLVIAPHAELHFLPFGAMIDQRANDRFLIELKEIIYVPSATAWVQLGERRTQISSGRVLALAPKVDRLPASRQEVSAIGRIYGRGAIIRIGSDASERMLRQELPNVGTVHLATFGVLNKHNPLFSFVELSRSAADDGRLEVNEVFSLGLSGQVVVLSACETGLSSGTSADVPPGDDRVGLVGAFLEAGASNVVASLWPVDDHMTAVLMEEFHKRLAQGRPVATALAEAQRALIRQVPTTAPYYWAGFVSTGNSAQGQLILRR
jgi:CHAT domain-containing protein/Flp pilus assembly protein TadD